jgi:SPP1 gp7 family putative phage head morphogenesis protein
VHLATPDPIDTSLFNAAVKRLFELGGYSPALLTDVAVVPLMEAIRGSLTESLKGIAEKVPEELLNKLKNDVFVFGGCKTIAELREASSLLIDDKGKVRTWNSFKGEMTKLNKLYNETYLEAEYNFATQSANMASRWAVDTQDGDKYNLQYRTAGDNEVRQSHQELNNITLPQTNNFWSKYYPPNGWRCRCTAVQVLIDKYPESDPDKSQTRGEQATTQINKNGDNTLEMFRFNPGKDEVVFPQSHPYYKLKGDLNGE